VYGFGPGLVVLSPIMLIRSAPGSMYNFSECSYQQIATIFWTGFAHFPGQLRATNVHRLPHTWAFYPTVDRNWLIDFWNLDVKWIFVALPIGFLLMLLFYYDHVGFKSPEIERDVILTTAKESKQRNSPSTTLPTQETRRLPLGLFPARMHQLHHRYNRPTFAKRTGTASSCSHRLFDRVSGRSQDNQDGRRPGDPATGSHRGQCSGAAHLPFPHGLGYHWNNDRSAFGCPEFDTNSIVRGCVLCRWGMSILHLTYSKELIDH